jgi:hypothetical protein
LDDEVIPKVGDAMTDPLPPVFELVIEEHVKWVNPQDYGIAQKGVNPADYFITSGDAVEKVRILERDLRRAAEKVTKNVGQWSAYTKALGKAAKDAAKLLEALKRVRGGSIFLETEWSNHKLLVIPKNPRK